MASTLLVLQLRVMDCTSQQQSSNPESSNPETLQLSLRAEKLDKKVYDCYGLHIAQSHETDKFDL